jgi:AcrR family transcriptional regulator
MSVADQYGPPARRRRKDARPQEIVAAAIAEFAARGFAAARLEDVAKRAGVSKATIYVYYKDKEALFEACMRLQVAPLLQNAGALVDMFPGPTDELIRLLITTIYKNLVNSDAKELIRIVIAESENFPFLAEMHHRETVSKGKAILTRIVERGIARGEFRQGPYAKAPMVIAGAAIMATIWSLVFQRIDPMDFDDVMNAHIDLVLNGVLQRSPP